MSTTEQPAIGSAEWARNLSPSITTGGALAFSGTQVWTDDKGNVKGQIWLGSANLTFRTPQQVRDLIGQLAALAGEMDAEITRHVRELLPQTSLHEPGPQPKCWQCGATEATAPLVESAEGGDWQCSNRQLCAGRQAQRAAARDADAAKAGT